MTSEARSYLDVQREFDDFKRKFPDDPSTLESFARGLDSLEGSPTRQAAYHDTWYKKLDAMVEKGFRATGVPQLAGEGAEGLGQLFDLAAGTNVAPTLKSVGEGLPRMLAESVATIPEAVSGVGAPVAAATWANRLRKIGQFLGYGSAATRGYAETESPLGAAMGAGQMYLGNKLLLPAERGGVDVGRKVGDRLTTFLERGTPDFVPGQPLAATSTAQRVLEPLARVGTEAAAATGINELTRQGMMSVGPNAVPLMDEQRNPLTQENIAANVAGSLMFAPQLALEMRNPRRVSQKQGRQLYDFLESKNEPIVPTENVPTSPLAPEADPALRGRHEAIYGIIRSELDAARAFDERGQTEDATRARENALDAINEAAAGRFSPMPDDLVKQIKTHVDEEARMQPPSTPEGFQKFVDEVRSTVDLFNENRVRYEGELASREAEIESLPTYSPERLKKAAELEQWKTSQQKAVGESWHPSARDPVVLDRVWKSGDLQPLTEDWLAKEWNATFDSSGNPEFSTRVVAQKVANYFVERLDSAVKSEAAGRKAVTEPSKRVTQISETDHKFAQALGQLPEDIRDAVLRRTVEIQRYGNFTPSQADALGVSEGTRTDPRSGRPVSVYPTWQKAVIRAVTSFDPETRTVLLPVRGKGYQRVPYSRLVEKGPSGTYAWEPSEAHVPVGAGGKPAKEGSIEAMAERRGMEAGDVLDEEEFKRVLAETGGQGLGEREVTDAERLGTERAPTEQFDVPDESGMRAEDALGKTLGERAKGIEDALKGLSDDQLWLLASSEMNPRNMTETLQKAPLMKDALVSMLKDFRARQGGGISPEGQRVLADARARGVKMVKGNDLENLQVILRRFFKANTPVVGSTGKLPANVERVGMIVKKLLDPKVVERVKGGLGPKAAETMPVGQEKDPTSSFANPPRPGRFTADIERTYRARFEQLLGRQGYSGTTREFLTEVAVTLARQMDTSAFEFYRVGSKEHGLASNEGQGKLGINVDLPIKAGQEGRMAVQILQTLAHEISHMDGYIRDGLIARPDAYSDERRRVYSNMRHLADNLTPDERAAMLETARDALPEHLRTIRRDKEGRIYGTNDAEEFVSEMNGFVALMLMNDTPKGRAAAKELLDYGPTEVREFAKNTFQTVHDVMASMKTAIEEPSIRADEGKAPLLTKDTDPFILDKGFQSVVDSARVMLEPSFNEANLAATRNFIATLTPGTGVRPPPEMTNAMWFRSATEIEKQQKGRAKVALQDGVSQTSLDALDEVGKQFSPRTYDRSMQPSRFARWIYPFTNLMTSMERQGVPIARDVLNAVMSMEPGISRLYSGMMRGFLKQLPDGSYDMNAEHPLVRRVAEEPNGNWRTKGVDVVSRWQQENGAMNMFVKSPDGTIVVNDQVKGAKEAWEKMRTQLSREDQQIVPAISVALDEANQQAAGYIIRHLADSNVATVATYLMAANKRMTYDQAWGIATQVNNAYLAGAPMTLGKILPPDQLAALDRLLIGNKTAENQIGDGLLPKFLEVQKLLQSRPGFRSESLPHDWVVKYKDGDKTLYASAPLEGQAIHLANRLRAEGKQIIGEVANKNELRSPMEYDTPDALLAKMAETEEFVFDRFVNEMSAKHGESLAEELRAGYSPLGQSLKELRTRGLQRFLTERRSLVDRGRFDYIDGTMHYLQRLSASLGIRGTQQQLRLILNDPRARLLPSFRRLVEEHIGEMVQPTGEFGRQMKAFTTTYMLGANLGSALVNATQSGTTLVPWLIAGDSSGKGFIGAWKDLVSSAADAAAYTMSDDWQRVARGASGKDASTLSLDEAKAVAYRQHVENGGINRSVIDDLMYGRDQRMLINARFGKGDYGPVPVSKMVRDKLYVGSQMMMSLYKWVEHFNARTAFLAGVDQGYRQGLRGDALYDHAVRLQSLATFGGGRANAPGIAGSRYLRQGPTGLRSAVGVANALQQYGYGVVATFGQLGKDALGQSPGLNALQRRQAQKAFGAMLMTQTAVAGVMGLPFVAAALTALEKIFGVPATQAVRETFSDLAGDDSETGALLAEWGMNGLPSQMLGVDVSSRLGTSSLLGTSAYRGFDLRDMAGPVSSIVGNVAESLNYFSQGRPREAAHSLAPPAFRNAIEMSNTKAKYGDYGFRDKAGNLLYTPTPDQRLAYMYLGYRPRELSQKRQMQRALGSSDQLATQARDTVLDRAAEDLLRGDTSSAERLADSLTFSDPTFSRTDVLRQIVDRAVGATTEKDLLATGSRYNEGERLSIARTFGADVNPRRSEVEMQDVRLEMARRLGDPRLAPTMDSYRRAAMVDDLVRQQGMTRSEAVRLVEFLGR